MEQSLGFKMCVATVAWGFFFVASKRLMMFALGKDNCWTASEDPGPELEVYPGWQGHIWMPCRFTTAHVWDVFSSKAC